MSGSARRSAQRLAPALLALAACQEPSPPAPEPTADTCPVELAFRPSAIASAAYVVGEWNGFARGAHPLTGPDATGTYQTSLEIPRGEWGYFFLIDGTEVLDPDNPERVLRGADEYSLLDLVECGAPAPELRVREGSVALSGAGAFAADIEVTGEVDRFEAMLRTPDDLPGPDTVGRPLTSAELTYANGVARIELTGLSAGKYRITLRAVRDSGAASTPLRLPFWIEPSRFDFADGVMYLAFIDRFRNGNPANDTAAPGGVPSAATFQGGDLEGIEQALGEGYFDALGVTSIWITPFQTQPAGAYPSEDGNPFSVTGYHGYWPTAAREVDERYGGGEALGRVVREAHRHGIRIIMDGVVNHVHAEHEYLADTSKASWFRNGCICGTDWCGWDAAALYCLFRTYMPDVDWSVSAARTQFIADMLYWLDAYDLDGLRLDAVKHVEREAISALATAVRQQFGAAGTHYYIFGETYAPGDYGLIKSYIGPTSLDGQFDFPLYAQVPNEVFAIDAQGFQHAKYWLERSLSEFAGMQMVRFIGGHDEARFVTKADAGSRHLAGNKYNNLPGMPSALEPYDRLYAALMFHITTPGVPLLYYGDEYGEYGAADPDNRHMGRFGAALSANEAMQLERSRRLLSARRELRGLARGDMTTLWANQDDSGRGNLWAYVRWDTDPYEAAVVVLSRSGVDWPDVFLDFPPALGWSSGRVVDILSDDAWDVSNSQTHIQVPGRGGVILRLAR